MSNNNNNKNNVYEEVEILDNSAHHNFDMDTDQQQTDVSHQLATEDQIAPSGNGSPYHVDQQENEGVEESNNNFQRSLSKDFVGANDVKQSPLSQQQKSGLEISKQSSSGSNRNDDLGMGEQNKSPTKKLPSIELHNPKKQKSSTTNTAGQGKTKHGHHHFLGMDEEDSDSDNQENEEDPYDESLKIIDYKKSITTGSFLPVVLLLSKKLVRVEEIIEPTQGSTMLHYAAYFGKIKAIKALVEVFEGDINITDYRGQTPLHVASACGELKAIVYMCGNDQINNDVKDNALMTPLMNTAGSNHSEAFLYLYFKEQCSIRNVDLNGNTLLHLAARSNCVNIARLLRHIYNDATMEVEDTNIEVDQSPDRNKDGNSLGKGNDQLHYFDLNRQNTSGQTPLIMTVGSHSIDMMKFLMQNNPDVTVKDNRGDTVKDSILRYMQKDTIMINAYRKYENRMLITKLVEQSSSMRDAARNLSNNWRWEKLFFFEIIKLVKGKFYERHNLKLILLGYLFIYLFHWLYVRQEGQDGQFQLVFSALFHGVLLLILLSLTFLTRSSPGFLPRKHITRDRDNNLIGVVLDLVETRQFHKIEELSSKYCYECMIVKQKHADHCKHCRQCVSYKYLHSHFFNKCIGENNARSYFFFIFLNIVMFSVLATMMIFKFMPITTAQNQLFKTVQAIYSLVQYSIFGIIVFGISQSIVGELVEHFLELFVAISRKMTVNELLNVWAYKYCFKVITVGEGKNFFSHRFYSLWAQTQNVVQFLLGTNITHRVKKNKSKGGNKYQDFDALSTFRSTA